MADNVYDLIIIGGGPAGITAGIYATRFNLKVLLIEKMSIGGQVVLTSKIDNYPGFADIDSISLSEKFSEHAQSLGVEMLFDNVVSTVLNGTEKVIVTEYSGTFKAKSVILATGARPRMLGLQNEKKLIGKGVCYCAVCDGGFFANKKVVVVGGGNSAIEDALLLSNIAKEVFLVHVLSDFQANASLVEKLKSNPKIKYVTETQVVAINGTDALNSIVIQDVNTKIDSQIPTDGLFISIGRIPNTELFRDQVNVDQNGYIITDEDMKTNIEGVWAVGDIRQKKIRQIVTACADGAISATNVYYFLK